MSYEDETSAPPEVWEAHRSEIAKIRTEMGDSVEAILAREEEVGQGKVFDALCTLCSWKDLNQQELTDVEAFILAVREFSIQVQNGGLNQWLTNSSGDEWKILLDGMRAAGDTEGTERFEKLLSHFPKGRPPKNREERCDLIFEMEDALDEDEELFEEEEQEYLEMPYPDMDLVWEHITANRDKIRVNF